MTTTEQEAAAWVQLQAAKRYSLHRKSSTGILRHLTALDAWERAADEKFKQEQKAEAKAAK